MTNRLLVALTEAAGIILFFVVGAFLALGVLLLR